MCLFFAYIGDRYIFLFLISGLIPNFIDSKLLGVVQVMRHGARCPIDYYQDVIEKYYPFKQAELTNQGFSMAYEKGVQTREYFTKQGLYQELISNPEAIQVFSTPYERTIFTSLSYLQGLFPGHTIDYIGINDESLSKMLINRKDVLKNTESFLKDTKNYHELQSNRTITVEVFDKDKRYLYWQKCIHFNTHKVKKFYDRNLNENQQKLVFSLKHKYPKMFEEYCHKHPSRKKPDKYKYSRNNKFNMKSKNTTHSKTNKKKIRTNKTNKTFTCDENVFKTSKFIKAIGSTLESINYHIEPVDPEILKWPISRTSGTTSTSTTAT